MWWQEVSHLTFFITVAAAVAASAAVGSTESTRDDPLTVLGYDAEEALLLADDACWDAAGGGAGRSSCALNALQLRGQPVLGSLSLASGGARPLSPLAAPPAPQVAPGQRAPPALVLVDLPGGAQGPPSSGSPPGRRAAAAAARRSSAAPPAPPLPVSQGSSAVGSLGIFAGIRDVQDAARGAAGSAVLVAARVALVAQAKVTAAVEANGTAVPALLLALVLATMCVSAGCLMACFSMRPKDRTSTVQQARPEAAKGRGKGGSAHFMQGVISAGGASGSTTSVPWAPPTTTTNLWAGPPRQPTSSSLESQESQDIAPLVSRETSGASGGVFRPWLAVQNSLERQRTLRKEKAQQREAQASGDIGALSALLSRRPSTQPVVERRLSGTSAQGSGDGPSCC